MNHSKPGISPAENSKDISPGVPEQESSPPGSPSGTSVAPKGDDKYKKLYDTPLKRTCLYLIGSLLLLYLFASVFPFLLDYYVEDPGQNVFS